MWDVSFVFFVVSVFNWNLWKLLEYFFSMLIYKQYKNNTYYAKPLISVWLDRIYSMLSITESSNLKMHNILDNAQT